MKDLNLEEIREDWRELARRRRGMTSATEWLLDALGEAVAREDAAGAEKRMEWFARLVEWARRPEFIDPPTAKVPRERQPGEKLDLLVYGIEGDYASFPNIVRMESGRLIITFGVQPVPLIALAGDHPHQQSRSDPCWAISDDGAHTWRITREREDAFSFLSSTLVNAPGAIVSSEEDRRPSPTDKVVCASRSPAHLIASLSEKGVPRLSSDETGVIPRGTGFTRCADGSLLVASSWIPPGPEAPWGPTPKTAVFDRSTDEGKTWQRIAQLHNEGNVFYFTEPDLYTARDGRVVCLLRTQPPPDPKLHLPDMIYPTGRSGTGWYLFQAESTDHGHTWSEPVRLDIWGHPPCMLRLGSGEVLLVYGHRRPLWTVRAILSHDDARTWDMESMRVLYEFEPGMRDFGYPVTTQLSDGTILCTYYGYPTGDTTRWASSHGIFLSLFDEAWLSGGQPPGDGV